MGLDLSKIRRGDIFFTQDRSIISRLIRLVTTGECGQDVPSHTGIIYKIDHYTLNGAERYVIHTIEALITKGVCHHSLNYYLDRGDVKVWVARMKGNRNIRRGIRWAETQIGQNYDYMQIVGIWLRAFFRFLGPKVYERVKLIKNFLDSKICFICSELVETYAQKTGKRLWHSHISQVTPYDLFRSEDIYFLS